MKRSRLGVAAAVSAALGWLTLMLGARIGGQDDYQVLASVWATYYGAVGILAGIQQKVVLCLVAPTEPEGPRLFTTVGLLTLPVAAVATVLGFVSGAFSPWLPLFAIVAMAGGALFVTCLGQLAADGRVDRQAGVLVADAAGRLMLVVVAMLVRPTLLVPVAMVLAAWVWIPAAPGSVRSLVGRRMPFMDFARGAAPLMVVAGCGSLLLAGMPALATLATGRENVSTGVLAGLVLLRSPILVLVLVYRPTVLAAFARTADVLRLARVATLVGFGAAVLAFPMGAWLGPPAVAALAGPGFDLSAAVAGALATSAVLVGTAMITSLATAANGRAGSAAWAWSAAVICSVIVLVLGPAHDGTVAGACLAGPLTYFAVTAVTHGGPGRGQSRPSENAASRS